MSDDPSFRKSVRGHMRRICLINNYNYGRFLTACLRSAVLQSVPFDLILVVDDGSTDESRLILEGLQELTPTLFPHYQENGGQLSCFNAAVPYIHPDDMVWCLDSDDLYPLNYVESVLACHPFEVADFVFSEVTEFNDIDDAPKVCRVAAEPPLLIPASAHLTRKTRCWIGAPTSTLVLKGELFLKLLPYPHLADWRVRADDILVLGASLVGARKLYLPGLRVGYRVHGGNRYYGSEAFYGYLTPAEAAVRAAVLERLFDYYRLPPDTTL
ncbi:MAG: glycosyltransferase family 2 protein [Alphaproteobacteria bacterium]|nr:glycosyltransferase family 2 protein [Alphaproteobacteria bacterium]